ncbi:MAG TPA: MBL fold metallo-hydrolase [Chitinophagales bacterium]|nr:MBL fold metallo-hydrolase [Chitinophagales bacterium]HQO32933.1 MBL fold metallo-hydrolase [Chitinophagales bacterium]HQO90488.1 MBL fold metallo-hydrolase [Chitinophagales bacterium]
MAVRRFNYEFDGVHYYRFSVYRLGSNVQTVYAYVVDDLLIDTAQSHNQENILLVAEQHKINKIILTHHHEDHSGNVSLLMDVLNVDAYAHPETVRILKRGYKVSPLAQFISGGVMSAHLKPLLETDIVETAHHRLQPIYTPGHCTDHYCYYEKERGWLFSGDLYVADKIKYFANFESLLTQIESLKKLVALDFDVLFCAHNPKTVGGKQRLRNKLQFFEDFAGQVEKYYRQGHNARQIFALMGMKENYLNKYLTFGNFCAENMVHSVVKDLRKMDKMK